MKKSLAAFLLALCFIAPAYAGVCFDASAVTAFETKDGSTSASMNKDETTALIAGIVAMYPQSLWVADNSIVFTNGKATRVVFFIKGCATIMVDIPTEKFLKIVGEPL